MTPRFIALLIGLALGMAEAHACDGSKPRKLLGAPVAADAKSNFEKAQALEKSGRVKEAVALYDKAGRGNHGPSARALADIYDRGKGDVQKDYGRSLEWAYLAYDLGEDIRFSCR